jgi:hypothetical protein
VKGYRNALLSNLIERGLTIEQPRLLCISAKVNARFG